MVRECDPEEREVGPSQDLPTSQFQPRRDVEGLGLGDVEGFGLGDVEGLGLGDVEGLGLGDVEGLGSGKRVHISEEFVSRMVTTTISGCC